MLTNFAARADNHNYRLDPIIRSLLDIDWYKLVMLQFIWKYFSDTKVTFSLINRKRSVRIADDIDEAELCRQLDHTCALRVAKSESIWIAGNMFYGLRGIFEPAFIAWFADIRLPGYRLEKIDGQWVLTFEGRWEQTTLWEIYALSIISELRTRAALARLTEFELDILYARAKAKLWSKIERLRGIPGLKLADFGTRRRHSFLWQEYVVLALKSELGAAFAGTSNVYLAYKHDMEAIGTYAHELHMVLAALSLDGKLGDLTLKDSQYEVLRLWIEMYGGAMMIALPDTFGSTQFYRNAPAWVAKAISGIRLDSKDPFAGGDEAIQFFANAGEDPLGKLLIPSDGLDVGDIISLHAHFGGRIGDGFNARTDFHDAKDFLDPAKWTHEPRIRDSAGWGTLLTNDFRGCHPRGWTDLDPISLVCKVSHVEGRPAVKLSDNYEKATGPASEIALYRETFGSEGVTGAPVLV
jgi:nicotinate phosphoribosyltransferase